MTWVKEIQDKMLKLESALVSKEGGVLHAPSITYTDAETALAIVEGIQKIIRGIVKHERPITS